MMRITDMMSNRSLVHNLNRQQYEMDRTQNQLSTGQKIQKPSDDPAIATNQMFYRTRLNELDQFENNIGEGLDRLNHVDGQLQRATDIMQRIRELSVQAANGIYQGDKGFELREVIAAEVDQHLRGLIEIANGRDATGRFLFGGHVVENQPFEIIYSNVPGLKGKEAENQIVSVVYKGDTGRRLREVDRDQYIDVSFPGNEVFWGTNMTVTGGVDTSNYTASTDQRFRIDGVNIDVSAGDTIDDIIDKINNAGISVNASKIGMDFLSLNSTSPHQVWLEDMDGGTVLQDLGLVSPDKSNPPNNFSELARVSGMSIFDSIIKLRNDLYDRDQLEIGGQDLGNIDLAMENMMRHLAETGARQNRLHEHEIRTTFDKTYMNELLAKSEGIDLPETIMNLKWLESVHQYALNVGSKIIRPTLMDFLR